MALDGKPVRASALRDGEGLSKEVIALYQEEQPEATPPASASLKERAFLRLSLIHLLMVRPGGSAHQGWGFLIIQPPRLRVSARCCVAGA